MSKLDYQFAYRRHLPHIQPPGATLFITFRLYGSIPVEVQKRLHDELRRVEARLRLMADPQERARQADLEQRRYFGKWDKVLDTAPNGPFWLKEPPVANLMVESLHYWNGRVYELDAFCVMPNHVHLVCTPLSKKTKAGNEVYYALSAIMHSLKLYTSSQANQVLRRTGQFWQHENYDHVIRDEEERQRIITYVLYNPVKAGLVQTWEEWPWSYCRYSL